MKELSIFIDESGDFGEYHPNAPYYIVTLVFHDSTFDVSDNERKFRELMKNRNMPGFIVHSAPIVRRESEYKNLSFSERKSIFDSFFHFVRTADITYHTIIVAKKNLVADTDLTARIAKQLMRFLNDNLEAFMEYDPVVVYYDYGQPELTNIVLSAFHSTLNNTKVRKATPADYILLQAADMLCTLELFALKADSKSLSKSETAFFLSERNFRKAYLKAIHKKRFGK
jgi:uncharacterized protein YdhG (YjbR/CyaY superfamily)